MGCTLLEIMADGMYAVFHKLEADLCAYFISPRMDRGSSEEGVDDFLRLIFYVFIVSYLGSAIFFSMLASTFTSVALIHSYLLSSELLDFGELPSDGSRERYCLTD